MDLLEGAMAFAVVMIILSTAVTGIVEYILRLTATRPKVLYEMIERFLKEEVLSKHPDLVAIADPDAEPGALENKESAADDPLDKRAKRLAMELTRNPVASDQSIGIRVASQLGGLSGYLARMFYRRAAQVDKLTTYAFLQRLAKTEIGEGLIRETEQDLKSKLEDISRTFERYVAASNELFRKKTQVMTMIVALLLALVINVDAGRLFGYLMDNPEARRSLIAEAENASVQNQKQLDKLERVLLQLRKNETPEEQSEESTEEQPEEATEQQPEEGTERQPNESTEQQPKEIQEAVDDLKEALAPLIEDAGLPIGWDYFPHCKYLGECEEGAKFGEGGFFGWLVNVALAGVLIGLGGPFWYRLYSSLAQIVKFGGMLRRGDSEETIQSDNEEQVASKKAQEGDLESAFRIAAGTGRSQYVDDPVNPPIG